MYSDGRKYMPAITVREHFRYFLPQVKRVLVLGGGMASMVHVLHEKGFEPQFTIVETNKTIMEWAIEFTPSHMLSRIEPVCDDAANFMSSNHRQYDLIFIDVFIGRVVPDFIISESFLLQCRQAMAPGGHIALNYIINNIADWQIASQSFANVFPSHTVADKGENRIFFA